MLKSYLEYIAYPAVLSLVYAIYWGLKLSGIPEVFLVYTSISVGILFILLLELYNPYRESWKPNKTNYSQDLVYMVFVQVFMPLAIRFSMIALLVSYGFNKGVVLNIWPRHLPVVLQVILIILIGEFFQYWWHRLAHKVSFLWAIHSVHHFPKILYSVNTARFHPFDKMFEYFVDVFLFIVLGADLSIIYLYYIYFSINGFFQHSNTRVSLGPLNYLIATAELHRLHHDVDANEAMHNYGNNTIIWDLVFGTYKDSKLEVGEIGVHNPLVPNTIYKQMIHPFGATIKKYLVRVLMFIKYKPDWDSYNNLAQNPNKVQLELLKSILQKNNQTTFGKEHRFLDINDYNDFKKNINIHEYEYFRPWINRIINGEKNILTSDEVDYFVTTSGTTGLSKYIPMTEQVEIDLKEMQNVLIYSIFKYREDSFQGDLFTVVGSAVEERVGGRFDCGSMSGKLYAKTSKVITKFQAVPAEIYEIDSYELKYTLLCCLALLSPNTTLFTTANPSTLLKLNDVVNEKRSNLFKLIKTWNFELFCENEKEKEIVNSINWDRYKSSSEFALNVLETKGRINIYDYWSNLKSVVTWTKGSCEYLISTLKEITPGSTSIIELGYLSSEFRGTVNVNGLDSRSLPTLKYNFFEFIAVDQYESGNYETLLVGDLIVGQKYYILVTTKAGLYRYFINDIVQAKDGVGNTPCIEFVQKGKGVTNITGEKLCEQQVLSYFSKNNLPLKFFICLADPKNMEYRLYYDGEVNDFTESLHMHLSQVNVEYKAKTLSGRLKKIKAIRLKDGVGDLFKAAQVASGQRDSQLKHLHLDYLENVKFIFEAYKK